MTEDIRPAPTGLAAALDRNRAALALGILVPLEILPAVGLWMALSVGSGVGLLAAVVFLVVCALPSAGVWRRAAWAPTMGIYLGWTAVVLLAVLGASRGFGPAHVAVAALHLLVVFALTLIAPRAERTAQKKDDKYAGALKENIEAIVVAFIMALVIRCFCIEVFKIPTSSMEPTLMGDSARGPGDRIMVTKPYYLLNDIERFDVVVFKFPLNQVKNFIKRVVGLPGEDFFIDRGNVWARKAGTNDPFRVQRKPLRTQRSIWIRTNIRTGLESTKAKFAEVWQAAGTDQAYSVENGSLRTLQHGRSLDSRFTRLRDITDEVDRETAQADTPVTVGEIGVTFHLEIHGKEGAFFFENPTEFGRFRLELSTSRDTDLLLETPREKRRTSIPRLEPHRTYRIEFLTWDGISTVFIDGEEITKGIEYLNEHDPSFPTAASASVHFGAVGTTFTLSNLDIGRDVHYRSRHGERFQGPENKRAIPEGCFVMMGDNVNASHDSRKWREVIFKLTDEAAARNGIAVTDEMRRENKRRYNYAGAVIRCESQELIDSYTARAAREEWAKKRGHDRFPDHYIAADHLGYERGIFNEDLAESLNLDYEEFFCIERDYIVGKALWIWFPMGRWFRLIR